MEDRAGQGLEDVCVCWSDKFGLHFLRGAWACNIPANEDAAAEGVKQKNEIAMRPGGLNPAKC